MNRATGRSDGLVLGEILKEISGTFIFIIIVEKEGKPTVMNGEPIDYGGLLRHSRVTASDTSEHNASAHSHCIARDHS